MHGNKLLWVIILSGFVALSACAGNDGNVTPSADRQSSAQESASRTAGLRSPRGLREARTLRPTDRTMARRGLSGTRGMGASPSTSGPTSTEALETLNQFHAMATQTHRTAPRGTSHEFSGSGRGVQLDPGVPAANSSAGRTTPSSGLTWDPVSGAWVWN